MSLEYFTSASAMVASSCEKEITVNIYFHDFDPVVDFSATLMHVNVDVTECSMTPASMIRTP